MRLPPAPWLLLALLFLVTVPPSALPQHPQDMLAADPPAQTVDVIITASGADPQTITVTTGTTVYWHNADSIAHTITSDGGSFGPFPLGSLDTASYLFGAAGAYGYTISAVPMAADAGTIEVTASTPAATATPSLTVMPSPTWTASPSSTPSPTATASPAPSASPTLTPSATASNSPSATPTASASATLTARATATPTQTNTPTSTATAMATPLPPDTVPVTITDSGFVPQVITVTAGMYVEWTNAQAIAVALTSASGLVGSDRIPPGGSYRTRFAQPGAYGYNLAGSNGFAGAVVVLPAPSPTAGSTTTASPTASATSSATATASPTAAATGSAIPTASNTAAPTATVAVVDIPLSGDPPSPCAPSIQTGSAIRWSNENGVGGPSYYLAGLSPVSFTRFGAALDPGQSATLLFVDSGTYIYRISSAGRVLVPAATILVGDTTVPCPMPTSTIAASATPTAASTQTSGGDTSPTPAPTSVVDTATATPTATPTSSPSATPTSTPTPSATASPHPSNTPAATPTSSPTAPPTASATDTPTHTPTPSATPTARWTASPTSTPPPENPTVTEMPPATASSTPAPSTPAGAAGATPTRVASTAKPTPTQTPRRSSTPAAAPRRQSCLVAVPHHAAGVVMVNGYARHGHTRVDLAVTLPIPLSARHSTLHLRDPAARLALTSTHISRVRLACTDLRVAGLGRIGKRTMPFTVEIQRGRHSLTLTATVPARHYRLGGTFHGHLALRLAHKSPHKPGTNKRSGGSGHPAGHGGKKVTAHGGKH